MIERKEYSIQITHNSPNNKNKIKLLIISEFAICDDNTEHTYLYIMMSLSEYYHCAPPPLIRRKELKETNGSKDMHGLQIPCCLLFSLGTRYEEVTRGEKFYSEVHL